ncbi:nucleoside triphosphate pyrophosphohydrolase [Thioalkalivibrio sp. XN8]|uniref:nucleoside triphosphate pyrophosphohydrolase n=1 Tax=Thioalkalivibrio sp. XN8 TaxID=2712863 RepID=UPI0013EA6FC4|nr:nucleoside triphosphate pyrophosphohydrolase [Thioalkalivibrio sp. XN8]NGP54734.1 nucleoside triphosphate pyrophosphohydrolase [Thioalkalivibrio sp. XN8]
MTAMQELLAVMARLRDPERGCPWDLEQDFSTIAPYTIEEAYEVADAIERGDLGDLRDELGDLLFQVVFHARLAEEQGAFDFAAVAAGLVDKMKRRHPHVFGDAQVADAAAQTEAWEAHKARERAGRRRGALDDIPVGLPALARAQKLGRRAARVGFDWPDAAAVLAKLDEERAELAEAMGAADRGTAAVEEELGDLLFTMTNLARHLQVDAEGALRRAAAKFERRFRAVEARLAAAGLTPDAVDAATLERFWEDVKEAEAGR